MGCKDVLGFAFLISGLVASPNVEAAGRRLPSVPGGASETTNLRIDGMQVLPPVAVAGLPFRVSFRVLNDGPGTATNFVVRVTCGDQVAPFTTLVPALAAGAQIQLAPMFICPQVGACRVAAKADATGVIPETDEKDNGRMLVLQVRSAERPNLRIETLIMEPPAPAPGAVVRLKVVVRNAGTAPSTPCFAEIRLADEATAPSLPVPVLSAGSATTVERSVNTGARVALSVTAKVDVTGIVSEREEGDNSMSVLFQVGNRPDLAFAAVKATPTLPVIGGRVRLMAWIRNLGTVAAGRFAVDFVRGDGGKTARAWCESLAPGATATPQVLLSELSEGLLKLTVRVDATGSVAESNEANNALPFVVRVGPKPLAPVKGVFRKRR